MWNYIRLPSHEDLPAIVITENHRIVVAHHIDSDDDYTNENNNYWISPEEVLAWCELPEEMK